MKDNIFFLIIFSCIFFTSCKQTSTSTEDLNLISPSVINNPQSLENSDNKNQNLPIISFADSLHDFGTIKQGDVVEYSFKFKNTGKTDLVISTATASCGCTVPYYPQKPIKPNEEENIKVVFNSSGKKGVFKKEINVVANTIPSDNKIHITGEIVEQPSTKK